MAINPFNRPAYRPQPSQYAVDVQWISDHDQEIIQEFYHSPGFLPEGAYIGSVYSQRNGYECHIHTARGEFIEEFDVPRNELNDFRHDEQLTNNEYVI
jgi:hypothetical protein